MSYDEFIKKYRSGKDNADAKKSEDQKEENSESYESFIQKYRNPNEKKASEVKEPQKTNGYGEESYKSFVQKYRNSDGNNGTEPGGDINSRLERFDANYRSYWDSAVKNLDGVGYANANSLWEENSKSSKALREEADGILWSLYGNEDAYDPEAYKAAVDYLTQVGYDLDKIEKEFSHSRRYYGQWDTEEDYNAYIRNQEMKAADPDALRAELKDLEEQKAARIQAFDDADVVIGNEAGDLESQKFFRDLEEYDAQIAEKRQYLKQVLEVQRPAAENERYQQMLSADPDALKAELKYLEDLKAARIQAFDDADVVIGTEAGDLANQAFFKDLEKYDAQITEKRQYLNKVLEVQEWTAANEEYQSLMSAEDFAEKSKYVSTANGRERSAMEIMMDVYSDESSGWDDPLYEYVNGNKEAGTYISDKSSTNYGPDNALGSFYGRSTENKAESQQMTKDEVAIFNYIYATQGKEAAHAYYDHLQSNLNARQRAEDEAYAREYARESPVAASVFTVLMSPLKGLSYMGQVSDYLDDGRIDQNAQYNKFSYMPTATRGQVSQMIEESGKWGKVGSFAYQTGMSMGDFLMTTAVTGGNGTASMLIMGSGAAADTTIAAKDRGLSDEQAFQLGTVAGLSEALCERVSLGSLLNTDLLRNSAGKYILKNMITEGLEEVTTSGVNLMADILISKDQSEWQLSIDAYMKQGMTESEAFAQAMTDQAAAMGMDFLGGFFSGGIMSAGSAITYRNNTNQIAEDLNKLDLSNEDIQSFIQEGLASDRKSDAYAVANEMQKKLAAGKKLTSTDISRLYQANVQEQPNAVWEDPEDEPQWVSLPTLEDADRDAAAREQPQQVADTGSDRKHRPGDVPEPMRDDRYGQGAGVREQDGTTEDTDVASEPMQQTKPTEKERPIFGSYTGIREIKRGSVLLDTPSGEVFDSSKMLPSWHEGIEMFQLVSRLRKSIDINTANQLVRALESHEWEVRHASMRGMEQAYNYGYSGRSRSALESNETIAKVPEAVRNILYDMGAQYRQQVKTGKTVGGTQGNAGQNVAVSQPTQVTDPGREQQKEVHAQPEAVREDPVQEPEWISLPVPDQLNQEMNGGTTNGKTNGESEGPAAAQPGGYAQQPGTGLLHGDGRRNDRAGAREQTGKLAGSPEQSRSDYADNSRAAIARQNYARSLRLEKISSRELGLQKGTETRSVQVMPREHWDNEMTELADRIYQETGKDVTYVIGRIQIRGSGDKVGYARGAVTGDRIIIQADHLQLPIEKIADHEAYHAKVDFSEGRLNNEIRRHIIETYSEEEFQQVLDQYIVGLRGVIDVSEASTREEFEAAVRAIEEELFADAYAGINAFGAGADRFTSAVNEKMDQLYMGKHRGQENGTEQPTGPPAERFSYAGENAETADLDALERAKEMQSAGVADETIRQQTGWFMGMDGKWRWEIDDSGMQYSRFGDALFSEMHPEYARHQELTQKWLYGELTPQEEGEFRELDEVWASENQRLRDRVKRGNAQLQNMIRHDPLFEAYPQLRQTRLRFADLPEGTRGQYDPERDVITLSENLRGKPQDTLIHEIQHVIQKTEGFAQGASPEFWEQVQKGERPVRVNDRRMAEAERKIQEILDSLPPFVAGQFELHRHLEKSDPDKAMELADDLSEGPYGDKFSDFFLLTWDLDMAAGEDNYIRGAGDLYRNTAGEIEARDAAARRQLTAEQRQAKAPSRADDRTVFVEDVDDLNLRLGERFSVDDMDSDGHELSQQQQDYFSRSQARDRSGRLQVLYHQTDGDFTIFNTRHPGAGSSDNGTPFGIFLKRSSADIGLTGKKQMALYANITNPLRAENREELSRRLREISSEYDAIYERQKQLDAEYHEKHEQAKKAWHDYITEWRTANPNASRRALNDDPRFNELFDAEDAIVDEWTTAADRLAIQAKEIITEALRNAGYDGVFLQNDAGSWGRQTDTVIALDSHQVKSISNKVPTGNPDIRYSIDESGVADVQEEKQAPKKPRPVAESRPILAKQKLRNNILNQFSIPGGQRAELGAMIDSYADRLIKNGCLTEEDRKSFFDRMYESGVMTVPANDYYAEARNYMKGGKVYVPDSVVQELGDDWNETRRRAFAAGIILTRSRENAGIDVWNSELAADIPGLFDENETDQRVILERIIQVAEEGRDEHLSLQEYTARLAGQGYTSEEEFLDTMERQFDWALRTFAENADLELQLRDRTGVKIAQERDRYDQKLARQRMQELQRRAEERQARKDSAKRAQNRKELQELQQRTLKQLQWLNKNRNRAPEELKEAFDEVLGDIDLYAVSAADEMRWSDKHNATWKDLAQMYKDAMKNDPNFLPSKELERIVTRLDATKIADMDLSALQGLYKAAIGLRTEFYNRNNVINDEMQRLFAEVYTDAKQEIESAPGENSAKKGKVSGWADKFLNLDQLTPMNTILRMVGWNPDSVFYSMAKQLERGERDMRAYSVKAQKMLQDFLTEHQDWVKIADGQGKDAIWYEVEVPQLLELGMGDKPIFGPTVTVYMTPAQKVHMYLESKNLDNLRHMTGGRTFADKELYSKGKRQEALAQGKTIRLAPETVKALVSDLTPQEMELAQILDRYYNTFATQEINRVSNVLCGYDKAMGKNYAPICVDKDLANGTIGIYDETAESVGHMKERQHSYTPSYNISAFDAFELHVEQTARFCGMAIPARNWNTFLNWKVSENGKLTGTRKMIAKKWGNEGVKYIENLITSLQGGDDAKSESVSTLASRLQSNYISAVFGANPSIVLKQLGSIPLAGAYLDVRNFPRPKQLAHIDRDLISRYTQELEWRTMGYATPETKQLKDNPNWTQTNKAVKFLFGGGAITAMDGWAASTLWPWAENKVRREYPELEVGTQEQIDKGESAFYKKVAEEFENALSRSQSVSDEIHQGTLRKSKNPITRAFTLFRSDSAQTYNALRQTIGEAGYYSRQKKAADARLAKKEITREQYDTMVKPIDAAVKKAKKAAGTTFAALMLNAIWAEGVSFLMAYWKNKGKYYRDDEEELTAESVIGEMCRNMMESIMGTVIFGDEIAQLIGNAITGDQRYDLEAPGLEQINEIFNLVQDLIHGNFGFISEAADVVKNGGNLGKYLSDNSGEILGGIKNTATKVATYFGLSVNNVEAYLLGALKWVSPELGAAYDDLFRDVGKSDLAGSEGDVLESRIGGILEARSISDSDETAQALTDLYAAGYKEAVPSDTPDSISIDGEEHSLGTYQQQAYDTIWGSIVADGLDDLVGSEKFADADSETQAKMLSNLYTYAAERTKAEMFDDYEMKAGATENAAIVAAGATIAECITWDTITGGKNPDGSNKMNSAEKAAELTRWDLPEAAKREIFQNKISDSREDAIEAFQDAGLSFGQFLRAYSKYGEINGMDLKAGQKAIEFSHWVNDQGYTAAQAAVVKDELTYFSMTPADAGQYDDFVESGMDPDDAYDLTGDLGELQPEEGEDQVSDLQKWRTCVDFSDNVDDQLTALFAVMTEAQYQKVEIANDFGVTPDAYVTLQEIKVQYDSDGNGAYKNSEIQDAIDALPGKYTDEQKAVLWQLATGSKSAKNNPYSREVGQRVLDAKKAAKDKEEETELPGLTLGNW